MSETEQTKSREEAVEAAMNVFAPEVAAEDSEETDRLRRDTDKALDAAEPHLRRGWEEEQGQKLKRLEHAVRTVLTERRPIGPGSSLLYLPDNPVVRERLHDLRVALERSVGEIQSDAIVIRIPDREAAQRIVNLCEKNYTGSLDPAFWLKRDLEAALTTKGDGDAR